MPCFNGCNFLDAFFNNLSKIIIPDKFCFETIIVDDGSTDNSFNLLNNYSKLYKNVIIIHQENQGTFLARYNGIKHAKGKYVMFCDIDDYIDVRCFIELNPLFQKDYDIIQFKYIVHKFNNEITYSYIDWKRLNQVVEDEIFPINDDGRFCLYDKAYKRSILPLNLNKDRYKNCCYFEDYAMNAMFFYKAKRKYNLDQYLYHYVFQQNSACQIKQCNIEKLTNFMPLVDALLLYQNNMEIYLFLRDSIQAQIRKIIIQISIAKINYKMKIKYFNKTKECITNNNLIISFNDYLSKILYFLYINNIYIILILVCQCYYFRR